MLATEPDDVADGAAGHELARVPAAGVHGWDDTDDAQGMLAGNDYLREPGDGRTITPVAVAWPFERRVCACVGGSRREAMRVQPKGRHSLWGGLRGTGASERATYCVAGHRT